MKYFILCCLHFEVIKEKNLGNRTQFLLCLIPLPILLIQPFLSNFLFLNKTQKAQIHMVGSRDIRIKNGCALSAQQLKIKKINSVLEFYCNTHSSRREVSYLL